MSFLNILFIAIALSVDAMAVSAANGAHHHHMHFSKAIRIAFFFGLFHLLMPLIGWLIGSWLEQIISTFDHWIAFILLTILGVRMIMDSLRPVDDKKIDIHNFKILLLLSLAISIDALVVGMTFVMVSVNIWLASFTISLTAFISSLASIYIGKKCGEFWGKKAETIGGLVLVIIGFKILISHFIN